MVAREAETDRLRCHRQLAGIAGETAKQYAHRGEYDPRNLEHVLQWVNGRLAAKGLSLIGAPTMNAPDAAGMT